jgi:hypothetical protein
MLTCGSKDGVYVTERRIHEGIKKGIIAEAEIIVQRVRSSNAG